LVCSKGLVQAITWIILRQYLKNGQGVQRRNDLPVEKRGLLWAEGQSLVTVHVGNEGEVFPVLCVVGFGG